MTDLIQRLPGHMLSNYVRRYEAGGVQERPRLRFVDGEGRACVAGALAGAASAADFASGPCGRDFLGSDLEAVSRLFEDGRLTAAQMYRECLLERARRAAGRRAAGRRPEFGTAGRAGPDGYRAPLPTL